MIELSEKYEPLLLRPYIKDINDPLYQVDTFFITGGRFSGKSLATAIATATWTRDLNFKTAYTRYTMVSAKDSIIPEFTDNLELLNTIHEFDIQRDRVKHSGGGEVVFKGIKPGSGTQTANLKGLKGFNILVVDEGEELPNKKDFQKLQLSIRHPHRPNLTIIILNPTTKEHWLYKEYFESRGVQPGSNMIQDNVCYIHTSYLDCIEHVPPNILAQFNRLKLKNPKEYAHVVMGGWLERMEGVIYTNWTLGEFPGHYPSIYGQDYGYNDPTTLIKVAVDIHRRKIYVDEAYYKSDLEADDIFKLNKQLAGQSLIIGDNQAKTLIQTLRKWGNNIIPCRKDRIEEGIIMMQSFEIVVTPRSKNIVRELNNYIWLVDKKSGVAIDNYNHALDAIRYVVTKLVSGPKKTTMKQID